MKLTPVLPERVNDARSFALFAQQQVGTPQPSNSGQWLALEKQVRLFLEQYPGADWNTLVKTVGYIKNRRLRPATTHAILTQVRWAWKHGYLPELDPDDRQIDVDLEARIDAALRQEDDPVWRHKLLGSEGSARRYVYNVWAKEHQCQLV